MRKPVPTTDATKLTHTQIKQVLPQGWAAGKEYETECPSCQHKHLRLFGDDGVKCMNGCDTGALTKELRKRIESNHKPQLVAPTKKKLKPSEEPGFQGFTLADYSELKRLPESFLKSYFFVHEVTHKGKPAVGFPYHNEEGKVVAVKVRLSTDRSDTYFRPKDPHSPYGLGLMKTFKAPDIVLCEGESDTQTLIFNGVLALGMSGANGWRPEFVEIPSVRDAKRVFIIQEPDVDGAKFVQRVAKDLPHEKVFVVSLGSDDKDPSELHLRTLLRSEFGEADVPTFRDQFRQIAANAKPFIPEAVKDERPFEYTLETQKASTMKPALVEWLWPYRIPIGDLTAFAGNCDVGKSTIVADLIARITTGHEWPDCPNTTKPSSVLMCVAEGSKTKDIVPLLMAAGADLERVEIYDQMKPTDLKAKSRRIALNQDLEHVRQFLKMHPDVKLLVFDPLTGYLGVKKNDEAAIRSVLEPLGQLADETGVAVLSVDHFNKNMDQAAVNRVSGSQALTDIPRAVWAFSKKKSEDGQPTNERSMVALKGNLAAEDKKTGLRYELVGTPLVIDDKEVSFRKVRWMGKTTESAETALAGFSNLSQVGWLRSFLLDGEKRASEVFSAAEKEGYTKKQVYTAKDKLEIRTRKGTATEGSGWFWGLPAQQEDDEF